MKSLVGSVGVAGLCCIIVLASGAVAFNSSASFAGEEGIDANTPNGDGPASGGEGEMQSADHSKSDDKREGAGSASSPASHQSSNSINGGSTGSKMQQNGSNAHDSTYYYSNNQNNRINPKYDDEQTYLDLFGERAKELLTQHIIPSTDAECRWDWRMGRCEPYCTCAFQFLWGDYHLGRSCRFRPSPPPSQVVSNQVEDKSKDDATSWQEAWQEVWQTQMTEGSGDSTEGPSFVPPFTFPKTQSEASSAATEAKTAPGTATATTGWDRTSATTCTLPPESRYIQIIHQLNKALGHSTVLLEQFQRVKGATSNAMEMGMVRGREEWTHLRHHACETVKRKVEERAQGRDQPVVLTKQGATWIRRVCGVDGNVSRVPDGKDEGDGGSDTTGDEADAADGELNDEGLSDEDE